jgi:histidine triad (HIT) family protein
MQLTPDEQQKQIAYRDARSSGTYDQIWQSVGKCVFCDLNEKYIFFEENSVVMTISLFAYIDGHFMIVPRRHISSPKELTQLEWDTVRKFSYIAKKIIKDTHGISGMQLVQKDGANAQSTVDQHLHFHCIPFDAPDLCEWNYRQLRYTPLENVARYKQKRKKIINTNDEILFQHRSEGAKLSPDWLTLPGGTVEDFGSSLEAELAREIREETGLHINIDDAMLLASRLNSFNYARTSPHLRVTYPSRQSILWNTYVIRQIDPRTPLTPGDDCAALEWIPRADIATRQDISNEIKTLINSLNQ